MTGTILALKSGFLALQVGGQGTADQPLKLLSPAAPSLAPLSRVIAGITSCDRVVCRWGVSPQCRGLGKNVIREEEQRGGLQINKKKPRSGRIETI